MATLNYEIGKPKQDGTRKVSIIISHKGKRKRLPANIIVNEKDVSRNGNITSRKAQKAVDDKMNVLRNSLYELEVDLMSNDADLDWICSRLTRKSQSIDFFSFARQWMEQTTCKGKKNYASMLNSVKKFTGCEVLPFTAIDFAFLTRYCNSLIEHPRAQSLYLGAIRHIYNEAVRWYNNEYDKPVPPSPFESFKIPKHVPKTKDRVVSAENLVKIFSYKGTLRAGLARDCYVLSFCLMGMNSVDLYECTSCKKGVLAYERAKTKDRRADNAYMEITIPDYIKPLFKKYKGTSRVFDFYKRYTTASNFNKHINIGLKKIAKELGIPPFDFYSARHTWASIARNKLGIDKYTIHEALNHVSDIDITDIYIQRDFTNINTANARVVSFILQLLVEG